MSIKEGDEFEVVMPSFKRQKTGEGDGFGKKQGGWGKNNKYGRFGNNKRYSDKENWNTSSGSCWNQDNKEGDEEQPRMYPEFTILEREGAIDQVTIHYADIASLQMLGIISLDNYHHLSMIPPALLTDATYVIRVFKTILSHKKCKFSKN